jgi:hypothetical protein
MMKSKMMAAGGMPMVMKDGKKVPAFAADGVGKMAKGGMAKSKMMASGGYKAGGMVSKMMPSGGAMKAKPSAVKTKAKTTSKK